MDCGAWRNVRAVGEKKCGQQETRSQQPLTSQPRRDCNGRDDRSVREKQPTALSHRFRSNSRKRHGIWDAMAGGSGR